MLRIIRSYMKILHYLLLPILASCATNAGTGVFAGTVIGAGAGGISAGGIGALVGGASGIIAGSIIGAALDAQDRKVMEKASPRTVTRMDRGEPLTINDVIKLSQNNVDADTIVEYMQERKTNYALSQAQIRRMQEAGVSEKVINYMAASGVK